MKAGTSGNGASRGRVPPGTSRDLFVPTVPATRLDRQFQTIFTGRRGQAGRELTNLIFDDFTDVDKSFIREFQTSGFSARVFELALFAYLQGEDVPLDRTLAAPDFVVPGPHPVAIEVTTTNPVQEHAPPTPASLWLPSELDEANREFVFQLGKALRRKLLHRNAQGQAYWELPHVTGMPFVIAVGAFHGVHAQVHPMTPVAEYLYGERDVAGPDDSGRTTIHRETITTHEYNGRIIPSGLFRQPEAAHLSGVLFSNAHTFPMFNRIGTELELGAPGVELVRIGTCFDPDPHAFEPKKFAYVVGDRPPGLHETFAEGLHLFINPWAQIPLSPTALPNIPFIAAEPDGHPVVNHPGRFQPYISKTVTFDGKRADMFARYFAAWWMDLVPMIPGLFGSGPKTET